jgi:hypothetical protein
MPPLPLVGLSWFLPPREALAERPFAEMTCLNWLREPLLTPLTTDRKMGFRAPILVASEGVNWTNDPAGSRDFIT